MLFFGKKKKPAEAPAPQPPKDAALEQRFREIYDPFNLPGYDLPPRTLDELPNLDAMGEGLKQKAHETDIARQTDRLAGAKAAAGEILSKLIPMCAKDKDLDPTTVVAVLAALAGGTIVSGVLEAALALTEGTPHARLDRLRELCPALGLEIAKVNDQPLCLGTLITEQIAFFFWVAFGNAYEFFAKPALAAETEQFREYAGKASYWDTPIAIADGRNPKQLLDTFGSRFSLTFSVYCRHPQERLAAYAIAAKNVIEGFAEKGAMSRQTAAKIVAMYIVRTGHYLPDHLLEHLLMDEKAGFTANGADFFERFVRAYAPYMRDDFDPKPRTIYDFPEPIAADTTLRRNALKVDAYRKERPLLGAELAGQEMLRDLTPLFRDSNGNLQHIQLFAVLGSMGGRLCVRGLIDTLDEMIARDDPKQHKQLLHTVAQMMDLMLAETKDGDCYVMGNRIGNEFCGFLATALDEPPDPAAMQPLSKTAAETAGTPAYWVTPYAETVRDDPKALADAFTPRYETILTAYCRYPQERMLAPAMAALAALQSVQDSAVREEARNVLAEYGWRTSHHLGTL